MVLKVRAYENHSCMYYEYYESPGALLIETFSVGVQTVSLHFITSLCADSNFSSLEHLPFYHGINVNVHCSGFIVWDP